MKIIAENRQARFNYEILETVEAGIALKGSEVKSIRQGRVNLKEAHCRIENGELWLVQCHITPYEQAGPFAQDPLRKRKLLLHKRQILMLGNQAQQQSLAIVPLRMYLSRSKVKIAIALGRGKKLHDKRETLKKRTADREAQAAIKDRF